MTEGEPPPVRELILVARTDVRLEVDERGLPRAQSGDVERLRALVSSAGAVLRPVFEADAPALAVYFRVEAPDDRLDELAAQLRELDLVDGAYVKPLSEPASLKPDTTLYQGYLANPPGLNTCCAWSLPGGHGDDVNIIDIEQAWRFTHEDLLENQGGVVGGVESTELEARNHGTAVIGILGGDRNAFGITGICPDAQVSGESVFETASAGGQLAERSSAAIVEAADQLRPGDFILIEQHRPGPATAYKPNPTQMGYIALEWWPDDFDAILYATQRGIIVVAAAGNGAQDLDDPLYDSAAPGFPSGWTNPFKRSNRDSGAVVVGAGAPPPGTNEHHLGPEGSRLAFSNFGSVVDAQAWGGGVTSTGYGDEDPSIASEDEWYTFSFSGTSSASPIVTGSLACVQGILRAVGATVLDPGAARHLLRTTGAPQQDAPGRPATQRIGNRPDLCAMVARVLSRPERDLHELFYMGSWRRKDLSRDPTPPPPSAVGNPSGYTWAGDGGQHVVYRDDEGDIHELFLLSGSVWSHNNLTGAAAGAVAAAGDPMGYTWAGDGGQHVVYRGVDDHIHELFMQPGQPWKPNNLTAAAGLPPNAAGDPFGYTWAGDGGQHVVYRGHDARIYELYMQPGQPWKPNDLTTAARAPIEAGGNPAAYTWAGDDGQHVVYRGVDAIVYELYLQPGRHWECTALNVTTATAADAIGDPVGYTWGGDNAQHVVYRADLGRIHEFHYEPGGPWQLEDLSPTPGAAPTAGDPAGYTWGRLDPSGVTVGGDFAFAADASVAVTTQGDGGQHVVYRGQDCHVHELVDLGAGWAHHDLNADAENAPPAQSDPTGYTWGGDAAQHVVYRGYRP